MKDSKLIIIAIRYERTLLLDVFPKAFVQPVGKGPSMGSCAPRCKRRINVEPLMSPFARQFQMALLAHKKEASFSASIRK